MDLLTGAFQILAAVLAAGGVAKLVAPLAFAQTLRSLRIPGGTTLARLAGLAEVALGAAAILVGGRWLPLLVAAAYAVFAVIVVAARRAGAVSCGCFGTASAPPGPVHVAVNAASGMIALAAAVVQVDTLGQVLDGQPLAGVPYLVLVALGAWLVVTLDTVGAEVADQTAAVHRLGPVFREQSQHRSAPARTTHRTAHQTARLD